MAKTHRIEKTIIDLKNGTTVIQPGPSGSLDAPDVRKVVLTPDYLRRVANTHAEMRKAGLLTPAPWSHGKGPTVPIVQGPGSGGIVADARDNAGFWDRLWFDEATQEFKGVVEAPGDLNDPLTPAGMLGTTVREASIYVAPRWTDGRGRVWTDAPLHVACCVHAIEPGQKNFQPESGSLVLSMSFQQKDPDKDPAKPEEKTDGTEGSATKPDSDKTPPGEGDVDGKAASESPTSLPGSNMNSVITMLGDAGIILPPSTTPENFLAYLEVALGQFLASSEEEDDEELLTQPPEGAKEKSAPFVMSFTMEQAAAIAKSGAVNPATGKPFTVNELMEAAKPAAPTDDVIMAHPTVQKLTQAVEAMTAGILAKAKEDYGLRVEYLKKLGVISADYAKDVLVPMIASLQMSFQGGQPVPQPLDIVLKGLESGAKNAGFNANAQAAPDFQAFLAMSHGSAPPAGAQTIDLPNFGGAGAGMTAEQTNSFIERMKNRGVLPA